AAAVAWSGASLRTASTPHAAVPESRQLGGHHGPGGAGGAGWLHARPNSLDRSEETSGDAAHDVPSSTDAETIGDASAAFGSTDAASSGADVPTVSNASSPVDSSRPSGG